MGLFDGLRSQNEPAFNEQRAIMTIVISAIMADGDASDDEISFMRGMCARSPIFSDNRQEEDDAVINFAVNIIKQLSGDAVAKAAAFLSPELKETAFAFSVEIVLADGIVGAAEEQFISDLAETLEIKSDLARKVIEVTLIRQRSV